MPRVSGSDMVKVVGLFLQNKDKDEATKFLPTDLPPQKNKKRCWACKAKLEPAQRALGGCKCGKGQ